MVFTNLKGVPDYRNTRSRDDEVWEENEVIGKSEVADFPVKIMQAI